MDDNTPQSLRNIVPDSVRDERIAIALIKFHRGISLRSLTAFLGEIFHERFIAQLERIAKEYQESDGKAASVSGEGTETREYKLKFPMTHPFTVDPSYGKNQTGCESNPSRGYAPSIPGGPEPAPKDLFIQPENDYLTIPNALILLNRFEFGGHSDWTWPSASMQFESLGSGVRVSYAEGIAAGKEYRKQRPDVLKGPNHAPVDNVLIREPGSIEKDLAEIAQITSDFVGESNRPWTQSVLLPKQPYHSPILTEYGSKPPAGVDCMHRQGFCPTCLTEINEPMTDGGKYKVSNLAALYRTLSDAERTAFLVMVSK